MKTNIAIIAIISLFVLSTLNNKVSAKENSKTTIYRSIEKNAKTGEKTISTYLGENDMYLVPFRRYVISYTADSLPAKKVIYNWDLSKNVWVENGRYEYYYYAGICPQMIVYSGWDDKTNDWGDKLMYAHYLSNADDELLTVDE